MKCRHILSQFILAKGGLLEKLGLGNVEMLTNDTARIVPGNTCFLAEALNRLAPSPGSHPSLVVGFIVSNPHISLVCVVGIVCSWIVHWGRGLSFTATARPSDKEYIRYDSLLRDITYTLMTCSS